MDFKEAFKMLEIEPTEDKKEIKVAYSRILKKYHPEEFPDVFIQMNEAYKVCLEYSENEFAENKTNFGIQDETDFEDSWNYEELEDNDFFDIFEEKEISEKSKIAIYEWIRNFKSIIISEKRPLKEYKNILNEFHRNFDEIERLEILNILKKKELLDEAWVITELERQLLLYNLNSTENMFEETFEINEYEFQHYNLSQIVKNLKSDSIEDIEKGYEEFISEYLNIKIFRLFGRKIALYSEKNIESAGKGLKLGEFMSYKISQEFDRVNDYIRIFDIEQKSGLGMELSSFAMQFFWYIFLGLAIPSILMFPNMTVMIVILGNITGTILDWINITDEKDFNWSRKYGVSSYLFIIMTIIFGIKLLITFNTDYEIPIVPILMSILLIIVYLFSNVILFIKMIKTSQLRYERLKEFSKKVLDVFIFNR